MRKLSVTGVIITVGKGGVARFKLKPSNIILKLILVLSINLIGNRCVVLCCELCLTCRADMQAMRKASSFSRRDCVPE